MEGPHFSDRRCPVCDKRVPPNLFGRHIMNHSFSQFEGGAEGALELLRESMRISIIEAEGFPREQAVLRDGLRMLDEAAELVGSLKTRR